MSKLTQLILIMKGEKFLKKGAQRILFQEEMDVLNGLVSRKLLHFTTEDLGDVEGFDKFFAGQGNCGGTGIGLAVLGDYHLKAGAVGAGRGGHPGSAACSRLCIVGSYREFEGSAGGFSIERTGSDDK